VFDCYLQVKCQGKILLNNEQTLNEVQECQTGNNKGKVLVRGVNEESKVG
jgi:hypothetical protein